MRDTHIVYAEQVAAPRPNWFYFVGKFVGTVGKFVGSD